ncbi:MAG: extracellular solute-binding protein [Chloroflexi bacterium]|nr:extracellular solute-binding protein [Chloroflexota bacterium]
MNRKKTSQLIVIGLLCSVLVLVACAAPAVPAPTTRAPDQPAVQPGGWEQDWQQTLAAAKREGVLSVYSPGSGETRQMIVKAFKDKYGIDIEWTSAKANEIGVKILTERRAGLYLPDVVAGGAVSQQVTQLKPAGALDPIKPILLLPEVTDPKLWYLGSVPFVDVEKIYTVNPILGPSLRFNINTDMVKPGELKSLNDLLAPRWKEKVIYTNPLLYPAATGEILEIMGPDYLKKLAANIPIIVDDEGLAANWLAHGKYPLAIINRADATQEFINVGAPIKKWLPEEGSMLAGGAMAVSLLNRAPHPNAAKVFINWYVGKEATFMFSKFLEMQSARLDLPTDFIPSERMRIPDFKYKVSESEVFYAKSDDNKKLATEIFGALLKR